MGIVAYISLRREQNLWRCSVNFWNFIAWASAGFVTVPGLWILPNVYLSGLPTLAYAFQYKLCPGIHALCWTSVNVKGWLWVASLIQWTCWLCLYMSYCLDTSLKIVAGTESRSYLLRWSYLPMVAASSKPDITAGIQSSEFNEIHQILDACSFNEVFIDWPPECPRKQDQKYFQTDVWKAWWMMTENLYRLVYCKFCWTFTTGEQISMNREVIEH